jgi:hypothetical protein
MASVALLGRRRALAALRFLREAADRLPLLRWFFLSDLLRLLFLVMGIEMARVLSKLSWWGVSGPL